MSIKLILPWVGELPWYWPLFESSVKNAGVVLVLVRGDCGYFRRRIEGALPEIGRCGLENGYKLCDFRPMFGRIFAEEIGDADYWAFGDCDLVYGRGMGEWLRRMVADDVDVACVRKDWTSGPFTLMKNCDRVNSLFERAPNWREVARTPAHCGFDELGHNWLLRYRHGGEPYDELRRKGNFAGIMWDAADVRFVHEDVLCEDSLAQGNVAMHPDGRLTFNGTEIAAFHFIAAKSYLGFNVQKNIAGHENGYLLTRDGYWGGSGPSWIGRMRRRLSGFVDFVCKCIRGDFAARLRVKRVLLRVFGNKDWWQYV